MNFDILGVFRKTNSFWGVKILWIFFEVTTKLGYFCGHFMSFFKVKVHDMNNILGFAKISNNFLGMPDFFV